jgi:threonyl-tRNA synthetase
MFPEKESAIAFLDSFPKKVDSDLYKEMFADLEDAHPEIVSDYCKKVRSLVRSNVQLTDFQQYYVAYVIADIAENHRSDCYFRLLAVATYINSIVEKV